MSLKEERMQVLKLLEAGKISPEEATKLLNALESSNEKTSTNLPKARWLRVKVSNKTTGKQKVNINLPIGLVNVAVKMGAKFAPEEMDGFDLDEIIAAIQSGERGKIIEVDDEEGGEHVEIFVE